MAQGVVDVGAPVAAVVRLDDTERRLWGDVAPAVVIDIECLGGVGLRFPSIDGGALRREHDVMERSRDDGNGGSFGVAQPLGVGDAHGNVVDSGQGPGADGGRADAVVEHPIIIQVPGVRKNRAAGVRRAGVQRDRRAGRAGIRAVGADGGR